MCGIIGIFDNSNNVIDKLLNGIVKLKHRGRNGYGITVQNGNEYFSYKNTNNLNKDDVIKNLVEYSNIGIAHTRYSTSYTTDNKVSIDKCQPIRGNHHTLGEFYLIHNGHINFSDKNVNYSDSQELVSIIENKQGDWFEILNSIVNNIPGVYNLIILTNNNLFALKDRYDVRPLCLAKSKSGYCISSESVAINDYEYCSEIKGGQLININNYGIKKFNLIQSEINRCLFEYIYFLRGESKVNKNTDVNTIRFLFGNELARREFTNIKDKKNILVCGSPDTGIEAAKGFADSLDLEYTQFIVKNKNYGRSFILEDDKKRLEECRNKLIIDESVDLQNKIVYFIDDSIVRGNTMKTITYMLKNKKVKEIHIRISSPMIKYICKFGIDIPTREELIMNKYDKNQFVKEYAIDTLQFLEISDMEYVMRKISGLESNEICTGCFTGKYKKELLEW